MPVITLFFLLYGYMYSLHNGGENGTKNLGSAVFETVKTYHQVRMEELYSHPAWWKTKQYIFHAIMITLYLTKLSLHMGKRTLLPIVGIAATPTLPFLKILA